MKLEDQVCSLELAKELKEFGVKQESAFYWIGHYVNTTDCVEKPETARLQLGTYGTEYMWKYAAFTVAELGEMLPLWYYSKRLPDGSWSTDHVSRMDILNTNEKTEADSRATMLIQIIERKIVRL